MACGRGRNRTLTRRPADADVTSAMMDKAHKKLASARISLEAGFYDDASSRAYYAAYHAVCASLALKGLAFSSHGKTLGEFNRAYVHKGALPPDTFGMLQRLFADRQIGDYSISREISEESAIQNITDAERILSICMDIIHAP